ncbi:MAG: hypothetical protein NXI31_22770 [bacterium]|nr:hypothetical protein [bacterium]
MNDYRTYRRRERTTVTAVRIDLDTAGFDYEKWGGTQRAKARDWLVKNGDDTYTIDADTFTATYTEVSPGRFEKQGVIWATQAETGGTMPTKEGSTDYEAGDWLVYNDESRTDGYAVAAERFEELYEPAGD